MSECVVSVLQFVENLLCSVLQCASVSTRQKSSCSVLLCLAVCCSVLQGIAVCRMLLQYIASCHCSVSQCVAECCRCLALCCSALQLVAVCCIVLQCVAVCQKVLASSTLQEGS